MQNIESIGGSYSFTVSVGDAYDLLDQLDEHSIDLIITSPPYWGHRTYGLNHNPTILEEWHSSVSDPKIPPSYEWYRKNGGALGMEPTPDWFVHHLVEIFERAKRVLKKDGNLWVNLGDTFFARWASIRPNGRQGLGDNHRLRRRTPMGGYRQEKQLMLIPSRFAIAMQDHRWILRNDLIWHKPNTPPRPERDRLRLSHEHFFHFVHRPTQGRAKYFYNYEGVESGANDVVIIPVRKGQNGHTATFPEEIIRPRILSSSPVHGVVLDPFCGSGRALEVAISEGRRAVGFDLVPSYVRDVRANLAELSSQTGLEECTDAK